MCIFCVQNYKIKQPFVSREISDGFVTEKQ